MSQPTIIREWPEPEECKSFIWLCHWDCGCLIAAGVCEISPIEEGDTFDWAHRYKKNGKEYGINPHGDKKPPTSEDGTRLFIDGLIECDMCPCCDQFVDRTQDFPLICREAGVFE